MTRRGAVEVGFVLLGFYAFLMVVSTTPFLISFSGRTWSLGWFFDALKVLVPGAMLAAFGWALIAWRRELSGTFFPERDGAEGVQAPADWQDGAYRFGFAMLGTLTLIRWVTGAFITLMMLLDSLRASSSRIFPESPFERMGPSQWKGLFASAATLAVGVYLLLGAPGLREWLVRRAGGGGATPAPETTTDGNG
ncbi:MAG: hypothetical protein ACYS9X_21320 [Planctomycetota bacterium]|jgi:hypothetical protein